MRSLYMHLLLIMVMVNHAGGQPYQGNEPKLLDIPPLTEIIDNALIYSPLLKAKEKAIEEILEETKIEKKKWMDNVYLEGAANYGD